MPDQRGSNGILATASIDYITATSQIISGENPLIGLGRVIADVARRDGNRRKPWSEHGYVGQTCGGVSMGTRDDGAILRVSGYRAANVGCAIINVADNVSRLDLQCTVRFNRDRAALDRQHEAEFRRYKRAGGNTRVACSVDGFGAGNTLVVGSRVSNYHGRIYDKWRESGLEEYRNCWRYEVECKGDGANVAAAMVRSAKEMEAEIARSVHRWFGDRGIDPRFAANGGNRLTTVARKPSNAEESLRYIYKQVTPLVRRLMEWYSEDDLHDVLFGLVSPETVRQIGAEQREPASPYEEWIVASGRQRLQSNARQKR